ncbi:MAG: ABC transporter substrate-binding protein [Gracilibacteraceae bacterium]|jgi:iron complex transport system substrate-binding protein|nr:ABC transporter substrate-binding protein [Gracilibacteraceae bacterium]
MKMKTKMKRLLILLLALVLLGSLSACGNGAPAAPAAPAGEPPAELPATRTVTGDDGVTVEIPYEVTKAAPVIGAFAQMTEMLTAGGGKIAAAATNNISDYFKQVFPDYLLSNPNDYNSSSVEDLIAAGAQVCYGPSALFSDDQRIQLRDAGIAYVVIDNITTVAGMKNAFLIIGEILGEEEYVKAQDFVAYYDGNIQECLSRTTGIAEEDRVTFLSLFYSANAYTTINSRDICHEYVLAAGAVNVAADYMAGGGAPGGGAPAGGGGAPGGGGGNSLTVDAEQIVAWNPQFIMTSNQSGKEAILADPALAVVSAVQSGNVHVCPYGVYLWSVRSGEGSMLPLWLGARMYPDLFGDVDMEEVVKNFFNDWYNYEISADEIQKTLAGDASTAMTR